MLFVGDDWAEDHHDVEVVDEDGQVLARRRVPDGLDGIAVLHALIGEHLPEGWADWEPAQVAGMVKVGIETDRGPWVAALAATGYEVFAIKSTISAAADERAPLQIPTSPPWTNREVPSELQGQWIGARGAAWLSVRRLVVVGLLDGELGRRVCLQAFVRDGRAGADRPAVSAVFKPLESTIEGRESVPQTSGHGVVDALFSQWLRRISHVARLAVGLTVVRLGRVEVGQQLLHPRPLRVQ
jgi:hypothetical protein